MWFIGLILGAALGAATRLLFVGAIKAPAALAAIV